jgi:hypothetical protein
MKSFRSALTKLDRSTQKSDSSGTCQPTSHQKLVRTMLATTLVAGSQLLAMMPAISNPAPTPTQPSPVVPTRTIMNGSFEEPALSSGAGWGVNESYNNSGAPIIWQTTEKGGNGHFSYVDKLEIWNGIQLSNGGPTATSTAGPQYAELNGDTNASLYQDVCVRTGDTVQWSLRHAVREDPANRGKKDYVNEMQVSITNPLAWTGNTPPTTKLYSSPVLTTNYSQGWKTKTGTWTNTTDVQSLRFAFEAIQGSPLNGVENKSVGNFIDDVQLSLSPLIDFLPSAGNNVNVPSTTEGNSSSYYYVSLRINGVMSTGGSVKINLTGLNAGRSFSLGNVLKGTATATGLTATASGNQITLNIPAGTYDANVTGNYIHIPIDFSDTTTLPNDRLTFTLAEPAGGGATGFGLAIGSTSCSGAPRSTVTTTLKDDDYQPRVQLPQTVMTASRSK